MATTEHVGVPRAGWSSALAFVVATGFGSGYSPIAPGTAGTAVGLAFVVLSHQLPLAWQLVAGAALCVLGTVVSTHVARRLSIKDPGLVVIDEIAGIWVALLLVPLTPLSAFCAFMAFRVLDMWKPFPARQLEALPEGLGIMCDDVMAGIYANLVVRAIALAVPLW